jgi:hypothetical protein
MTTSDRALTNTRSRSERVRARRARLVREYQPAPPEERRASRRKKKPRQRHDLSLSVARGAEVQLPAMPAVHLGARLLSGMLLLLMILALWSVGSSEKFRVNLPEVTGNELLSSAQVRSLIQLDGRSVFSIKTEQVVEQLKGHAEILSASVSLGWPNLVEILIVERQPIVEWFDAGRSWWLSDDGVAFIQHGSRPELVQIESSESVLAVNERQLSPVVEPELLRAAVELSAEVPEVELLQFDGLHGLGFVDDRGWQVYFGMGGDMTMKVRVYQAIVEMLLEESTQVAMVSVENISAPYYLLQRAVK